MARRAPQARAAASRQGGLCGLRWQAGEEGSSWQAGKEGSMSSSGGGKLEQQQQWHPVVEPHSSTRTRVNFPSGLRTLFGMHRVGKTPVLFCSLHNSNCIRMFDLPSFVEIGMLSSKKEVRTIELAAGGLLFTGDGAGELKVWRWAPQDQEPRILHKHQRSVVEA